jgi:hypothetical protein
MMALSGMGLGLSDPALYVAGDAESMRSATMEHVSSSHFCDATHMH